jgi:hypothetical protein
MKQQYCVRLDKELQNEVNAFALSQGMKPTTAAEFFVKLGVQSLKKSELEATRFDDLEEKLGKVFEAVYGSTLYLAMGQKTDGELQAQAKAVAAKSRSNIFD